MNQNDSIVCIVSIRFPKKKVGSRARARSFVPRACSWWKNLTKCVPEFKVHNYGHHFKLSITWHKPQMDTLRTCAPLIFSPHPKRIVVSFGQKQLVQGGPSRWKRRRWRDSAVWKEYTDAQKKGMAYDVAKQCKTYMINVRVCVCARAQGARQHP